MKNIVDYIEQLEQLPQPKRDEFKTGIELLKNLKLSILERREKRQTVLKEITQRFEAILQRKVTWSKDEVMIKYYEIQTEVLSEYIELW